MPCTWSNASKKSFGCRKLWLSWWDAQKVGRRASSRIIVHSFSRNMNQVEYTELGISTRFAELGHVVWIWRQPTVEIAWADEFNEHLLSSLSISQKIKQEMFKRVPGFQHCLGLAQHHKESFNFRSQKLSQGAARTIRSLQVMTGELWSKTRSMMRPSHFGNENYFPVRHQDFILREESQGLFLGRKGIAA